MYKIDSAPYLAISHVHRGDSNSCLVKDIHGRLRRVKPVYVGPFDLDKLCKFGAIVSNYFQPNTSSDESSTFSKLCEVFNIDPKSLCKGSCTC